MGAKELMDWLEAERYYSQNSSYFGDVYMPDAWRVYKEVYDRAKKELQPLAGDNG